MLQELHIENIAIIDRLTLEFSDGFNCLTGETGAGKSIIIDAINLITGGRAPKETVRTGCASADVTAVFTDLSPSVVRISEAAGVAPDEDGCLVISRSVTADGRSKCRVNGCAVSVSVLKQIGTALVNIHGQNDSANLLSPERHVDYIDAVADDAAEYSAYRGAYRTVTELTARIDELSSGEAERLRRVDMLRFAADEIEQANIAPGEYDSLTTKRDICVNSEKLSDDLTEASDALDGSDAGSAVDMLRKAIDSLTGDEDVIPELKDVLSSLNDIYYDLLDQTETVKSLRDRVSFSPEELDEIEDRISLIRSLEKKYGGSEEAVLDYLKKAKDELEKIDHADELLEELNAKFKPALDEARHRARELSEKRRAAAKVFSERIRSTLEYLEMPGVEFSVRRTATAFTPRGIDDMEFFISANKGQEPAPLAKIASGGELSRIMLAIKSVLAADDDIGTLIFDEIDTGVSGRAAGKIALKMGDIARERQVLCVTHLAQIASAADRHFYISKSDENGRTSAKAEVLDGDERVKETARLIAGLNITPAALKTAEEMISASKRG